MAELLSDEGRLKEMSARASAVGKASPPPPSARARDALSPRRAAQSLSWSAEILICLRREVKVPPHAQVPRRCR